MIFIDSLMLEDSRQYPTRRELLSTSWMITGCIVVVEVVLVVAEVVVGLVDVDDASPFVEEEEEEVFMELLLLLIPSHRLILPNRGLLVIIATILSQALSSIRLQ